METKKCNKCEEVKPISDYHKDKKGVFGVVGACKQCVKKKTRLYYKNNKTKIDNANKKYLEKNKDKILISQKLYREKNVDKIKSSAKIWREKNKPKQAEYLEKYQEENKEGLKEYRKKYYLKNRDKILKYHIDYDCENRDKLKEYGKEWRFKNKDSINSKARNKKKTNIQFKMATILRGRLSVALKSAKAKKYFKTFDLLGCDIDFFIKYIESQFKEEMAWGKFGVEGIHIDHIKPCALFDLTDVGQQKECFHYSNLQPLWAFDNLSKGSFYEGKQHRIK